MIPIIGQNSDLKLMSEGVNSHDWIGFLIYDQIYQVDLDTIQALANPIFIEREITEVEFEVFEHEVTYILALRIGSNLQTRMGEIRPTLISEERQNLLDLLGSGKVISLQTSAGVYATLRPLDKAINESQFPGFSIMVLRLTSSNPVIEPADPTRWDRSLWVGAPELEQQYETIDEQFFEVIPKPGETYYQLKQTILDDQTTTEAIKDITTYAGDISIEIELETQKLDLEISDVVQICEVEGFADALFRNMIQIEIINEAGTYKARARFRDSLNALTSSAYYAIPTTGYYKLRASYEGDATPDGKFYIDDVLKETVPTGTTLLNTYTKIKTGVQAEAIGSEGIVYVDFVNYSKDLSGTPIFLELKYEPEATYPTWGTDEINGMYWRD